MEFLCPNHGKYPMHCMVMAKRFIKRFGRVRSQEVDCQCPECRMEITYSFKVVRYKGV